MNLFLPKKFDLNEWFIIFALILSYLFLLVLRKKFPISVTILIIMFSATIARLADHLLAGPKLNFYNVMDTGKFELFDILSYFLYGPFACLFLYFYSKWNVQGIYHWLYLLAGSLFGVAFEWGTVVLRIFTFKDWLHIYSLPVYLLVQSATLVFYLYIRKVSKQPKEKDKFS